MVKKFLLALALVSLAIPAQAQLKGPWYGAGRKPGNGAITPPPPVGIPIQTTDNVQTIVNAAPANSTFLFKSGIHYGTLTVRSGDTYNAESGAILSGATLLTGWTGSSAPWTKVVAFTPGSPNDGSTLACEGSGGSPNNDGFYQPHPECAYPEDLFIDNVKQNRVLTQASGVATNGTTPGSWFFNTSTRTVYIWDNPAGHTIEISTLAQGVFACASYTNVVIDSLIIEKYATPTQQTAIAMCGIGTIIQNAEIRWNHAGGLNQGTSSAANHNYIHHNGQNGVTGQGSSISFTNNEVAFNNTNHYDSWWEAGGTKWARVTGLIITGNYSHDNRGPGLWTDIDNINVVYDGNTVDHNLRAGIMHEISFDTEIKNNISTNNGNWRYYPQDGCIFVVDSQNVNVHNNTCTNNYQGIMVQDDNRSHAVVVLGRYFTNNLNVHDNITTNLTDLGGFPAATGLQEFDDAGIWTSRNNHFSTNSYNLNASYPLAFYWASNDPRISFATWQGFGNDLISGQIVSSDTFTGTPTTDISLRNGEVNALWTKQVGQTGNMILTSANRMMVGSQALGSVYYSNAYPSTNEYTVEADFIINTTIVDNYHALWCRMGTLDSTGYMVQFENGSQFSLYRVSTGFATTNLGTWVTTAYANGTTVHVALNCMNASKTAVIQGVQRITNADNVNTDIGHGGFSSYVTNTLPTNSTGVHFDNFKVTDPNPRTNKLLHATNFTYQGAFNLPCNRSDSTNSCVSPTFDGLYHTGAIAYNANSNTVFVTGADTSGGKGQIGEVTIPALKNTSDYSTLNRATWVQHLAEATGGLIFTVELGTGTVAHIGGLLVKGTRLYGTVYSTYDGTASQVNSHFASDLTLNQNPVGPKKITGTAYNGISTVGLTSGYMAEIPAEWQTRLGGTDLTGNACLSVITRTSEGPGVFSTTLTNIASNPVGFQLIGHDDTHYLQSTWGLSWPGMKTYNGTCGITGVLFPANSDSVMFFGKIGTGPYCYGQGNAPTVENNYGTDPMTGEVWCYDPTATGEKGDHAYPYIYKVWAIDANDLYQVKLGNKQPWQVYPYDEWEMTFPFTGGQQEIVGVTWDQTNHRVLMMQQLADGGNKPTVHVFTVQ